MNRKMRAKLNNQRAKLAKERRPCSQAGKAFIDPKQEHCDECGDTLTPVAAVLVETPTRPDHKLH